MAKSVNSREIGNYNLSFKLFLDAVNEFEGYLTGLSKNDIITFTDSLEGSKIKEIKKGIEENKDKNLEILKKEIIPSFFDRTSGKYFTVDLINNNSLGINSSNVPANIGEYINIVYGPGDNFNLSDVSNNFVNTLTVSKEKGTGQTPLSIFDLTKNIAFDGSKEETVTKLGSNNEKTILYENPNDDNPIPKQYISGIVERINKENKIVVENSEVNQNDKPNRFKSPHLTSTVIKHPKLSMAGKNANHLPIFFNAIPPIEMSRCSPYLDVRVITKKFNKSPGMNIANHFRFVKNKVGNSFELDDNVGFGDYKPSAASERLGDDNYNINYMDIFTSPQTLSNANINRGASRKVFGSNNDNPVLEPIMPLMTLKNVNIDISGKGYGLMASKTATMTIILHDRSRLAEIAPLVASNQIAGTKIYIEYGWNHPEGGLTSDNSIGKYLNALKDTGFYQVYSSSYNFGDSGEVTINLKLAASGFRQTEVVHIGAGPVVPGSIFEDLVEQAVKEILEEENDNPSIKEVRKKLYTNSSNARNVYSHFTWDEYRSIADSLDRSSENFKANNVILKNKIKAVIASISGLEGKMGNFSVNDISAFNNLNFINSNKKEKKRTMIQNMYSKLEYMLSPVFIDPFLLCYVKGSNQQKDVFNLENKSYADQKEYYLQTLCNMNNIPYDKNAIGDHVTLGSLIVNFIAYPLASTCLYDEVNVVFHPMNHQSGGARRFTTANFPIPIEKVKELIQEKVKSNSSLNINSFLNLIERKIIKNRDLYAYGMNDLYKKITSLQTNNDDEKILIISSEVASLSEGGGTNKLGINPVEGSVDAEFVKVSRQIVGLTGGIDDPNFSALKNYSLGSGVTYKARALKAFKEYKLLSKNEARNSTGEKLTKIYSSDGLDSLYPASSKFTAPNITIDFEVSPVIDIENAKSSQETSYFRKLFNANDKNKFDQNNNGLLLDRNILTLHVYDQETISSPYEYALMSTKTEGLEDIPGGSDIKLAETISQLSFTDIKQIIKNAYPTINYGAMSATINKIDLNATTSGKLANVLIVDSFNDIQNAATEGRSYETPYESITLFPGKIKLECMGMPMIGRGNNIFIDFGTNTTLDNVYTVSKVSHAISEGQFNSSIDLLPANMGSVSTFRDKLIKMHSKIT